MFFIYNFKSQEIQIFDITINLHLGSESLFKWQNKMVYFFSKRTYKYSVS